MGVRRADALLLTDQTFIQLSLVRLDHGFCTKSHWGLRGTCSLSLSLSLSLSKL